MRRNDFQLAWQAVLSTGRICSQTVVSIDIVPNHSFLLRVCISFPAAFSAVPSTSAHNVPEMTIGSVVFQVAEGDITKEEGDAIVNITNQTFSLKTGILIDTMCEKSMCAWKGWEGRGASIFLQCFKAFYLLHSVVSVLLLRVQKFS